MNIDSNSRLRPLYIYIVKNRVEMILCSGLDMECACVCERERERVETQDVC